MSGTVRETAIRHSSPDRHTTDDLQPGTSAPRDAGPSGVGQRDAAPGETAPLNNPYAAPRFADRPAEDTTRTLR